MSVENLYLFIPMVGMVMTLVEDWTFSLHEEDRNHKFSKMFRLGYREMAHGPVREEKITLPAGTVLKVDRIYVRTGGADVKEFDSVTFWCNTHLKLAEAKREKMKRGRFWAKLRDVNFLVVKPGEPA